MGYCAKHPVSCCHTAETTVTYRRYAEFNEPGFVNFGLSLFASIGGPFSEQVGATDKLRPKKANRANFFCVHAPKRPVRANMSPGAVIRFRPTFGARNA